MITPLAAAYDARHAEGDGLLAEALLVPVPDVSLRFREDRTQASGKAQVECAPELPDGRYDVARELLARRCCALGENVELGPLVTIASVGKDTRIGAAIDGLVVHDREFAGQRFFHSAEAKPSCSVSSRHWEGMAQPALKRTPPPGAEAPL